MTKKNEWIDEHVRNPINYFYGEDAPWIIDWHGEEYHLTMDAGAQLQFVVSQLNEDMEKRITT